MTAASERTAAVLARKGIHQGIDFAALAKRLWALQAMRAEGPPPAIRFRAWSSSWAAGRAWRARVIVRIGLGAGAEEIAEVLLHELVHCSCPRGEGHGQLFRLRLIACAEEAFGLGLDKGALLAMTTGGSYHRTRAYAIDGAILRAMREAGVGDRLRSAEGTRAEAPRSEDPVEAAARRARAISAREAKRRTHAEGMLAKWEARLARAERLSAKWRKRIRYYELRDARRAREAG